MGGAACVFLVAEDAVVLADDVVERIAHQGQEIAVGIQYTARKIEFDEREGAVDGVELALVLDPQGLLRRHVEGVAQHRNQRACTITRGHENFAQPCVLAIGVAVAADAAVRLAIGEQRPERGRVLAGGDIGGQRIEALAHDLGLVAPDEVEEQGVAADDGAVRTVLADRQRMIDRLEAMHHQIRRDRAFEGAHAHEDHTLCVSRRARRQPVDRGETAIGQRQLALHLHWRGIHLADVGGMIAEDLRQADIGALLPGEQRAGSIVGVDQFAALRFEGEHDEAVGKQRCPLRGKIKRRRLVEGHRSPSMVNWQSLPNLTGDTTLVGGDSVMLRSTHRAQGARPCGWLLRQRLAPAALAMGQEAMARG